METATQILHRLTSYEPGREWDDVISDPRLVVELKPNDFDKFPLFYKRYTGKLPRFELPRGLPSTEASTIDVLARHREGCRRRPRPAASRPAAAPVRGHRAYLHAQQRDHSPVPCG
nr:hypothetical protein GCM10020092_079210 [Actinoplanes digitatis]